MDSNALLGLVITVVLGAAALYYPGILLAKRAAAKTDGRHKKIGVFLLIALTCWISEFFILKAIADYQNGQVDGGNMDVLLNTISGIATLFLVLILIAKATVKVTGIKESTAFGCLTTLLIGFIALSIYAMRGMGAPGRPFRLRSKCLLAAPQERHDWCSGLQPSTENLPTDIRSVLSQAWLEIAAAEYASVATFSKLSLQLMALGAPPNLLSACHQAALDEIEHARCCYSLASVYGAQALGPSSFTALNGVQLEKVSLEQLALESLQDGCLMEGYFAAYLDAASREALDPELKASLLRMSQDEARHAQLAWDILSWCLNSQNSNVASAIRKALANLPKNLQIEHYETIAVATDNEHGFLPKRTQEELYSNLLALTQNRASQLLSNHG